MNSKLFKGLKIGLLVAVFLILLIPIIIMIHTTSHPITVYSVGSANLHQEGSKCYMTVECDTPDYKGDLDILITKKELKLADTDIIKIVQCYEGFCSSSYLIRQLALLEVIEIIFAIVFVVILFRDRIFKKKIE